MWSGFPHSLQGGRNQCCLVGFRPSGKGLTKPLKLALRSQEAFLPLRCPSLRKNDVTHSQKGETTLPLAKVSTAPRTSCTQVSGSLALLLQPGGVSCSHLPCGAFAKGKMKALPFDSLSMWKVGLSREPTCFMVQKICLWQELTFTLLFCLHHPLSVSWDSDNLQFMPEEFSHKWKKCFLSASGGGMFEELLNWVSWVIFIHHGHRAQFGWGSQVLWIVPSPSEPGSKQVPGLPDVALWSSLLSLVGVI